MEKFRSFPFECSIVLWASLGAWRLERMIVLNLLLNNQWLNHRNENEKFSKPTDNSLPFETSKPQTMNDRSWGRTWKANFCFLLSYLWPCTQSVRNSTITHISASKRWILSAFSLHLSSVLQRFVRKKCSRSHLSSLCFCLLSLPSHFAVREIKREKYSNATREDIESFMRLSLMEAIIFTYAIPESFKLSPRSCTFISRREFVFVLWSFCFHCSIGIERNVVIAGENNDQAMALHTTKHNAHNDRVNWEGNDRVVFIISRRFKPKRWSIDWINSGEAIERNSTVDWVVGRDRVALDSRRNHIAEEVPSCA